ncbi:ABC transporter permease [Labrys monachus]|uniref:Iron(III) transport system permease protein n=1 Tax=Labrys monachus TaxID=217067 RepID=A0ABU0FDS8_9HYPH|nr:iron ABC transporter permease [Labrys monachus]MDQ0392767.1 iron(III) transport system permease protein [Labrys monachus]
MTPSAVHRRLRQTQGRPPLGFLALSAAGAGLVVLPLAYTVVEAFQVPAREATKLLFRPLVGQLLLNTLDLVAAATLLAGLVGTLAAYFVERTRFPGRPVFAVLAAVPLAVPPFISSYAWVSLSPALEQFAGALLVVTSSYFPLVYLPVAAALRGMDPALEDTARSLGVGGFSNFLRVVLPQLRPALLGGMLLVALNTLVEFGAFALLRFRTFTTEIFAEYRAGFNGPQASLLAVVLIALCLVCLFAEAKVRGTRRYARVDRGTRRRIAPRSLGRAAIPVTAGFLILAATTLGVPLGMIAYWLLQHNSAAVSPVVASPLALAQAMFSSIELAVLGAAFTLLLALPLAYLAIRFPGRLVTMLERAAYLAQGVPGIVVALALIALTVRHLRPLYQSTALLVVAYAILFLPLAIVGLRATFAQVQGSLEDAGRSLGLSRMRVMLRVVLPVAAAGIGAAAAIVFVSIVTELTTTLLLAPIGTVTLATEIWADTSTLAFASAAPYAALMTLLSILSTWLLAGRFGRVNGGEAGGSA